MPMLNLGLLLGSAMWQGQKPSQRVQTFLQTVPSSGLHATVTQAVCWE